MSKQTKQRSVKYPPKKGDLPRKKVKQVVKEVVNSRNKSSNTYTPSPSPKQRPSSKSKSNK